MLDLLTYCITNICTICYYGVFLKKKKAIAFCSDAMIMEDYRGIDIFSLRKHSAYKQITQRLSVVITDDCRTYELIANTLFLRYSTLDKTNVRCTVF